MKKNLIILLWLSYASIGYSQTGTVLKFNSDVYKSLAPLNGLNVKPITESRNSSDTWDTYHLRFAATKIAQTKTVPVGKMIFKPKDPRFVVHNDYGMMLFNKKTLETIFTTKIANSGSGEKITAVTFADDKIICAISELNDDCSSEVWTIKSADTKSGKFKTILDNSNKELVKLLLNNELRCPVVSMICTDNNAKNYAFKLSSDEFDNYCYKLIVVSGNDLKIIDLSCVSRLVYMQFISEKELFYVLQNNASNTIEFKRVGLDGKKTNNTGCYAQSGLRGTLNTLKPNDDNQGFYINYTEDGTLKTAHYSFDGTLIEDHIVLENSMIDLQTDRYFLAFDFNLYTMYDASKNEVVSIVHDRDICDIYTDNNGENIYSLDEGGGLKLHQTKRNSNMLLILENAEKLASTEIQSNESAKKLIANLPDMSTDFQSFSAGESQNEFLRKKRETDFIKTFELNNSAFVASDFPDADKFIFAQFDLPCNPTLSEISVFHIEKFENQYRTARYCGRCVREISYRNGGTNMLLAILPHGKIGFVNASDFIKQISSTKELQHFSFQIYNETQTAQVLANIFNN